jgi:hypothetical protein
MSDIYNSALKCIVWLGETAIPAEDTVNENGIPQMPVVRWTMDSADDEILNSFVHEHITFQHNFHFDPERVSMNYGSRDRLPEPVDFLAAFCFLRLLADDFHIRDMPFFEMKGELPGPNCRHFPNSYGSSLSHL